MSAQPEMLDQTPGIVRRARRPEGWSAPGPVPPGVHTLDNPEGLPLDPEPGEDLCYLTGEWRIFQRLQGHRWSLDDLMTAWCAARALPPDRVHTTLDLGCGIGSVLMMVAWRFLHARCFGIEAQAVSVGLARRSIVYNGIRDRVQVMWGDLRAEVMRLEPHTFDLITGTPPYFPFDQGVLSDKIQCGPCRFEFRGGVEDYCRSAARVLAPHGRFVVVQDSDQGARVEAAAHGVGLQCLEQCVVIPRAGRAPLCTVFTLAHAHESASQSMRITSITVRDRMGQWTDDFRRVREDLGMPSMTSVPLSAISPARECE